MEGFEPKCRACFLFHGSLGWLHDVVVVFALPNFDGCAGRCIICLDGFVATSCRCQERCVFNDPVLSKYTNDLKSPLNKLFIFLSGTTNHTE